MGMVKVLGYSEVSHYACLKVADSRGYEFHCYDFHCEFKRVEATGGLYYMLMGYYICGSYRGYTPLFGSFVPEEVLDEYDRLRHLLDVFNDRVAIPQ